MRRHKAFGRTADDPVPTLKGRSPAGSAPKPKLETMFCRPETDAEGESAGNEGEARKIDAGGRQADKAGNAHARIADAGSYGVAHAGVDTTARHDVAVDPAAAPNA